MPSSTDHISFALLTDLVEQRVPVPEQGSLLAHLEVCPDCSQQRSQLDQLINLMRTDDSVEAPQALIARALNVFQRRPQTELAKESRPSLIKRLVASLSFDSLSATPAFGFRSGQTQSRQLIFTAGEIDLDLRLAPLSEGWNLSGQVLGGKCGGGEVELQSEAGLTSAPLNDLCEFVLAPVPPGHYRLLLRLEDLELEIPELELSQQSS